MIWLVGIGGSLGAATRFLVGIFFNKRMNSNFPLGTFLINITGSFLLGFLLKLYHLNHISEWIWYMFGIGFCGAYTTFSTFSFETVRLMQAHHIKTAFLYIISSIVVGIFAASIGFYL